MSGGVSMLQRWLWISLTGLVGCATVGGPHVPDQQVARLTAEQRVGVDAAQKRQSDADLAVASERVGLREANRQVEIAELIVERERAAVDVAKLYLQVAEGADDAARVPEATEQLEQAKKRLARAQANLSFRESAEEWHAARVEHADAILDATGAALELERFNAVTKANLIDEAAAAPERGEFEEAVKSRELAVTEAKTEVSRALEAMRATRAAVDVAGGPLDGSPQGLVFEPPTGDDAIAPEPAEKDANPAAAPDADTPASEPPAGHEPPSASQES